uniref:Transmembrane protein n=1 Tax=Trypanosoma vivax (strain Y486) TaxID=1055687 RepID=G0TUZ8_TRYVY|nr:hypothetical protein TVY486_0404530 [Trypanosoma vivax Y486]
MQKSSNARHMAAPQSHSNQVNWKQQRNFLPAACTIFVTTGFFFFFFFIFLFFSPCYRADVYLFLLKTPTWSFSLYCLNQHTRMSVTNILPYHLTTSLPFVKIRNPRGGLKSFASHALVEETCTQTHFNGVSNSQHHLTALSHDLTCASHRGGKPLNSLSAPLLYVSSEEQSVSLCGG